MAWSQDDIIFPIDAVADPGPLPSGAEQLHGEDSGWGDFAWRAHSASSAVRRSEDLGPRIRWQCLERSGRRDLSARIVSGCGRHSLSLSWLSALDGEAVGRRFAGRRTARFRRRCRSASVRTRRSPSASALGAAWPPALPIRSAVSRDRSSSRRSIQPEGRSEQPLPVASHSASSSSTRSIPIGALERVQSARSPSSQQVMTKSFRSSTDRCFASQRCRTSSSTGRSPEPGTTISTRGRNSRTRWTRR